MRHDLADSAHVLPVGRTYYAEKKRWCIHSGSGVRFDVCAATCNITLYGDPDAEKPDQEPFCARVAIYVNGACVHDLRITRAVQTVCVLALKAPETVTIRIVKRSEAAVSIFAIGDIYSDAKDAICPSPPKKRRIEFIGDSITCGYGVEDPDAGTCFSTRYENAEKAYACLTGKALDADVSLVAGSGYGIVSGFSSDGELYAQGMLPPYYKRLGFLQSYPALFSPSELDWDFSSFVPDAIVLSLGTNDDSYCLGKPERTCQFSDALFGFLQTIRQCNPDATLFVMLGIMKNELYPTLAQTVFRYRTITHDQRIFCREFPLQKEENGYGSNWHPSEQTQAEAAALLTAWMQEQMNWNE